MLSFVYLGIYWNNRHNMLQSAKRIDGRVLWSNLGLLFWLSLFPFVIRWIGERGVTPSSVAAFGIGLFMAAVLYLVLEQTLIAAEGEDSAIVKAVGSRWKEWLSLAMYATGIASALLVSPLFAVVLYTAVAIMWLIPDRRFGRLQQ